MANEKEVKAQVKLRFVAANGQRMLAVRNLSVTMKKTAGLTMKTLESILSLADGNPNGKVRISCLIELRQKAFTPIFTHREPPSQQSVLKSILRYLTFSECLKLS